MDKNKDKGAEKGPLGRISMLAGEPPKRGAGVALNEYFVSYGKGYNAYGVVIMARTASEAVEGIGAEIGGYRLLDVRRI